MSRKYSLLPYYISKCVRLALLSVLCLSLISITSQGVAAPTGHLAYAVNGFDENLGRFDWNLYATALRGTKDFTAIPLNHKGMYPSWDPMGIYSISFNAGKGDADIYSINPDNPKNKKLITPISGTYRFPVCVSEWQTARFQRLYHRPAPPRKPDLCARHRQRRDGSYDPSSAPRMAILVLWNVLVP